MNKISKIIFLIFTMGLLQPLFAQQEILKEFVENKKDKSFCFYPSTLRMLNLSQNEEFNSTIKNIDKLLFYTLDSISFSDKSYLEMLKNYKSNGFEEFITMTGMKQELFLYGKKDEFVGVFREDSDSYAFYLLGEIGFHHLPALLNTIGDSDILNLLTINPLDVK